MNSLARAGVFYLADYSSTRPKPLQIQVADILAGWSAVTQICSALYARKGTSPKRGIVIDVSMFDMATSSMIMPLSTALSTNQKVDNGVDVFVKYFDLYGLFGF